MIRPPCRSGHCVFCHGPIFNAPPHFMRHTASSRYRLALAKKARQDQPSSSSKGPSMFLQLPLEIRLIIYGFCLQRPVESQYEGGCHICHSVEGGAWHLDNPHSIQTCRFQLYIYGIVPASLLRVNKQIHREAIREVYSLTTVRLCGVSPPCLPNLNYWLHDHPLRYTKFLMTGYFVQGQRWTDNGPTRTDTERFVRILNAMPNLDDLLVFFDCWHPETWPNIPSRRYLHLHGSWFRTLRIMRDGLRKKIKLRLRGDPFSTHHANTCFCFSHTVWEHLTSTKVVEILQRNGFSLIMPSSPQNISEVQPRFEMVRLCERSTGGAPKTSNDKTVTMEISKPRN